MTYQSVVLADGPVGYWPCQETSGTSATDVAGGAGAATYSGTVTVNDTTDSHAPGFLGNHVRLDGTSGYLALPGSGTEWFTPATNGFTFEGWIYLRSSSPLWDAWFSFTQLLSNGSNNVDDTLVTPYSGSNQTYVKVNGTSITHNGLPFSVNAWHHFVLTVSTAGAATVYLDGAVLFNGTVGAPVNQTRPYKFIGRSPYPGGPYLPASITHIAVYNKVLTGAQVANHFNSATTSTVAVPTQGQLWPASGRPSMSVAISDLPNTYTNTLTTSNYMFGVALNPYYTGVELWWGNNRTFASFSPVSGSDFHELEVTFNPGPNGIVVKRDGTTIATFTAPFQPPVIDYRVAISAWNGASSGVVARVGTYGSRGFRVTGGGCPTVEPSDTSQWTWQAGPAPGGGAGGSGTANTITTGSGTFTCHDDGNPTGSSQTVSYVELTRATGPYQGAFIVSTATYAGGFPWGATIKAPLYYNGVSDQLEIGFCAASVSPVPTVGQLWPRYRHRI